MLKQTWGESVGSTAVPTAGALVVNGRFVGTRVGRFVGPRVGRLVGLRVGRLVGLRVGFCIWDLMQKQTRKKKN